ncbi:hypothetical protein, partial [Mesorhizobium sp. M1142]
EAATFHVLVLSMGQNELQTGLDQRGKVTAILTPTAPSRFSRFANRCRMLLESLGIPFSWSKGLRNMRERQSTHGGESL